MNTEDAKLILASVHHGAEGDNDQEIAEAFGLLESDAELKAWFDEERAFDAAVSGKLAQIEPPADLKATLVGLLDKQVTAMAAPAPAAGKISWLRPPLLAAAAAVALVSLVAVNLFMGNANAKSYDAFRSEMVQIAHGEIHLHEEEELEEVYAWLTKNSATCPTALPECIGCTESVGCAIVKWNDQDVTLICLRNKNSEVIHCFVIPRSEFDKLPEEKSIRTDMTVERLQTCGWTDQKNVYLLVGSGEGVEVNAPAP